MIIPSQIVCVSLFLLMPKENNTSVIEGGFAILCLAMEMGATVLKTMRLRTQRAGKNTLSRQISCTIPASLVQKGQLITGMCGGKTSGHPESTRHLIPCLPQMSQNYHGKITYLRTFNSSSRSNCEDIVISQRQRHVFQEEEQLLLTQPLVSCVSYRILA